jgi:hypothetical protein
VVRVHRPGRSQRPRRVARPRGPRGARDAHAGDRCGARGSVRDVVAGPRDPGRRPPPLAAWIAVLAPGAPGIRGLDRAAPRSRDGPINAFRAPWSRRGWRIRS